MPVQERQARDFAGAADFGRTGGSRGGNRVGRPPLRQRARHLRRHGVARPRHVRDWQNRRISYLEQAIECNFHKISRSMHVFREWARERGLRPSETAYLARTRGPRRELRFSKSGEPGIERAYRTHFPR